MSFLRKTPRAAVAPAYTGMQVQTSSGALPIPIVWGVNQIAPNVIWTGDFRAIAKSSNALGKGGGRASAGYDYKSAVILGLCEGPIFGVGSIWNSQTVETLSSLGMSLFLGETPQSTWSYLSTAFPAQALGYNGTACLCSSDYDMGASPGVGALSLEVKGLLAGSSGLAGGDADPALVLQDFLTNPQYGVGFPSASLDAGLLGASGDCSYQTYCKAVGLALSPALVNQETANSILARWLQLTNSAAVWSGGLLKIIPYGDAAVLGANATFNPNATPAYDLDDEDFLAASGEDPVLVARSDPYSAHNWLTLEIAQRSNYYDATPIRVFDQNAIETYGLRMAPTVAAHEICDPQVAQIAAQLMLQRALYIRTLYTFRLSWEYCLLEPMDLVTLTDPGLGLARAVVRIVAIEEDEQGLLTVTAEECPGGAATACAYPVQQGASAPVDRGVAAAPVNSPVVFEPPAALTDGSAQIWICASGGSGATADPNWGGADVWLSVDDVSYMQIGQISAPARQGLLTAPLPAPQGPGLDPSSILSVDLSMSAGALDVSSPADAQDALTLCLVDHELLAYGGAALVGADAYALSGLQRALYGTQPCAHAAGAGFVRLDGSVFKYALPATFIGRTLYVKLQSFNIFGAGVQDLSACVAYPYAPKGSGLVGPVAQALAVGGALDYGLASASAGESDDFGFASDSYVNPIDLGLASS